MAKIFTIHAAPTVTPEHIEGARAFLKASAAVLLAVDAPAEVQRFVRTAIFDGSPELFVKLIRQGLTLPDRGGPRAQG